MWKHLAFACLLAACGSDSKSVSSDTQAQQAFVGLNKSISKSLALAFDGYNAPVNGANIPAQMDVGDAGGTVMITGTVDRGNCSQLSMNLAQAMTKYTDGKVVWDPPKMDMVSVTYDTTADATQPGLSMKLNASAGDTLNGMLTGDYDLSGDLKGKVTLDVMFSGTFTGTCPGGTLTRVVGSTHVTGTAVNSSGGMYTIDVML